MPLLLPPRASLLLAARLQGSLAPALQQAARPFMDIPSPPAWPLLGHMPLLMKKDSQERMHLLFGQLRADYGDIVRLKFPGSSLGNMVLLFNPEDIKTLYSNDGKIPIMTEFDLLEYLRKHAMSDRYVTTGLLNNTEDWYEVRTKVQQDMMRPKSALYYIGEMEDIAMELVGRIEDHVGRAGGELDPHQLLKEYALEAVGCVFLGARVGALKGAQDAMSLIDNNEKLNVMTSAWIPLPHSLIKFMPNYKEYLKLAGSNFDICKKHVDASIANIKDTDDTLLAKLVRRCGKDSPIPLIMGVDALQVGIDTTGNSASFLLYHLADHPEKQEKLHQELCEVVGPHGRITESALGKLKYLKACQTESQRMLPAAFGSSRRLQEDLVLSGYLVPKDTAAIRVGYSTSNDPANFDRPAEFLPERWLRGCPEKHNANAFANIPFGHGARSCIGRRFAELELYIMAAKVVQQFRMEYSGEPVGQLTKFLSVPDKDINIKFTPR